MIKLIVSDIDGTLLPYGQSELDIELFELIRRLRSAGVTFCPASGRQYHSLRALFRPCLLYTSYDWWTTDGKLVLEDPEYCASVSFTVGSWIETLDKYSVS